MREETYSASYFIQMTIRIDRIFSILLNALVYKKKVSYGLNSIPVLMYHSISHRNDHRSPYYVTNTTPGIFERHLQYLYEHNYRVLNLYDLDNILNSHNPATDKFVAITFDDGFSDFYKSSAPLLLKYDFSATVFLPTNYISKSPKSFQGIPCLTWNEVRELLSSGFFFGSHTVSHPKLYGEPFKKIEHELSTSKKEIEDQTGSSSDFFSYPYAFPDHDPYFLRAFTKLCCECGFKLGFTTRIGHAYSNDLPFILKRIPINNHDDDALFEAKLNGAYNWLYFAQKIFKTIKNINYSPYK